MVHESGRATSGAGRGPARRRWALALLLGLLALAPTTLLAQQRDPKSEAARYFGMGNAAYDKGNYDQAERMFRVCIALAPDLAGPYRRLGQALRRLGRCEQAQDNFLAYLRLRPDSRYSDSIREEMERGSRDASDRPGGAPAPPVASATLRVEVDVRGALVKVDGLEMGRSPLTPLTLKAGVHRVEASHPGHFDAQRTVDLAGGGEETIRLSLPARQSEPVAPEPPALVPVELSVSPAGAKVHVDDELMGLSPLPAFTLTPGTHKLRVVKPGFLKDERTLTVRAGQPVTLELKLMRLGDAGAASTDVKPWEAAPDAPRPLAPGAGPGRGPGKGERPQPGPRRWVLLGGGGASAACLVGGVVLGAMAWSKAGSYESEGPAGRRRELKDSGESLALGADLLLGAGVVLGAATVGALLLWPQAGEAPRPAAPAESAGAATSLRWRPLLSPEALGVQGALTW